LLFQLDTLADLGVGSTTERTVNIISKVSPDLQRAPEGTILNLVVKVTNGGSPVSGASLTVEAISGEGSVSHTSIVTDAQGRASVCWTLGPTTCGMDRVNTVQISGTDLSPVIFTATATPE
jgi:hypothetical protein